MIRRIVANAQVNKYHRWGFFYPKTFFLCCFAKLSYLPAAKKLGQGNIFTGVCLSTGGRGVCLSACWDTHPPGNRHPPDLAPPPRSRPPRTRHPPGPETPQEQTPPQTRHHHHPDPAPPPGSRLQHTVNERPVRIILECILVLISFHRINHLTRVGQNQSITCRVKNVEFNGDE